MKTTLAAAAASMLAAAALYAGPVSPLYAISAGGIRTGYIIQGNSSTSFSLPTDQSAIAVVNSLRVLGAYSSQTGSEYTLAGTPTGITYSYPAGGGVQFYDGTSDGTYNYSVDYYSGNVYRFGLNWTSPTVIFSTGDGSGQNSGITWNGQNNSLWIGANGSRRLTNYSMTGTVLTSFTTTPQLLALAFDPADGTLWGTTDPNQLFQYSTSGTQLSSMTYSPVPQFNSVRGMEFAQGGSQAAPEPGTVSGAMGGLLLLAGWTARRRAQ